MDLPGYGGLFRRRLDIADGREVVFSHNRSNEWYSVDYCILTCIPFGPPGRRAPPTPDGGGPGMSTRAYGAPWAHTSPTIAARVMPLQVVSHNEFDMYAYLPDRRFHGLSEIAAVASDNSHPSSTFSGFMEQNYPHIGGFDGVFSLERLERIMTRLIEADPHSKVPPPASKSAIEKLEKKKLDRQAMGGGAKVDCTICRDELHLADEVTVLPCKHWFHGECVVTWLEMHDTCPICRAPIENRGKNSAGG